MYACVYVCVCVWWWWWWVNIFRVGIPDAFDHQKKWPHPHPSPVVCTLTPCLCPGHRRGAVQCIRGVRCGCSIIRTHSHPNVIDPNNLAHAQHPLNTPGVHVPTALRRGLQRYVQARSRRHGSKRVVERMDRWVVGLLRVTVMVPISQMNS